RSSWRRTAGGVVLTKHHSSPRRCVGSVGMPQVKPRQYRGSGNAVHITLPLWVFEAGLGTSFLRPRVTWHSLPPDQQFATIFRRPAPVAQQDLNAGGDLERRLRATPGQCGWLTYNNVNA